MPEIADIRRDYKMNSLNETDLAADPRQQFEAWWQQAISSQIDEVNAMTLCTIDEQGNPDARIVLLKGIDDRGFIFFSNYESQKGKQMAAHPQVSLVFFWKELERQVRIKGTVTKLPEGESEAYFASRPVASQLGALASHQSEVLPNRQVLEQQMEDMKEKYKDQPVPKPAEWGGYVVEPIAFEYWQGRRSRLHDRLCYLPNENGSWSITRLSP